MKKSTTKTAKIVTPKVKKAPVTTKKNVKPIVVSKEETIKPNMTGKGLARKIASLKSALTKQAPPTVVKKVHVTNLENSVLNMLISMVAKPDFSDVERTDLIKATKLTPKTFSNVLESLIEKSLITTITNDKDSIETIFLHKNAYSLHPFSQFNKSEKTIELIVDNSKSTGNTSSKSNKSRKTQSNKPYGKFGLHGKNIDVKGFKSGDKVSFDIKDKNVVGEFVHVHVNNHSPEGYAVIKYEGKIYERVLGKIKNINKVISEKAPTASTKTKSAVDKLKAK